MAAEHPSSLHTVQMHDWLPRLQKGDRDAADLVRQKASRRLSHLACKMVRRFPAVARWEETEDVLQNAVVRLLRALAEVRPTSTREFFGLAAEQIRRELLDLTRRYQGPNGLGRRQTGGLHAPQDSSFGGIDPAQAEPAVEDLELWARLHEAVERLPTLEREVFSLIFYHGWKQAEISELLGVSDRSVRRRWNDAVVILQDALGGE